MEALKQAVQQSVKPTQRRSKHAIACAVVLGVVVAAGAQQMVRAVLNTDGLELATEPRKFFDGTLTQALEKQLDQKMPARASLIAFANGLRYVLLGGSGEQVRLGRDGWLFLTDELRHYGGNGVGNGVGNGAANGAGNGAGNGAATDADPERWFERRIDLISTLAQRLKSQGTILVVALVPDKARVYRSQLGGGGYPDFNEGKYQQALAAMRTRGVAVVDLLRPLERGARSHEVYYRTDTHWNQVGASLAAQAITQRIRSLKVELESAQFVSETQVPVQERPGDLLRLMGLVQVSNRWRPLPDREAPVNTREVGAAPAANSLFGDSSVPVVLTGTSYSLRGNFHGYLQQGLGAKVLNTAKDGGGFLQAITAYLDDESFKTSKPKVLVWEIPERMLKTPLTDETSSVLFQ